MTEVTYDTECYELACRFLEATPDINNEVTRDKLASAIQMTIEDWITYAEGSCENCGEARGKVGHQICHQIP